MIGFLGEYEVTLDAKGRFLLPAGFKKQLPEDWNTQFVVSRGLDACLSLYHMKQWEPIFTRVSQMNDFDPKVRQFQRFFLNGATVVDLDSAGRLLVPQQLKEYAGLEKDVVLFAKGDKIEMWDSNKYKQFFDTLSADDFSRLANEVMAKPSLQ